MNNIMTITPVITSFLDTDLYKITMQAAIHKNYPNTKCEFLLTNRTPDKKLNRKGFEWFCNQVKLLENLRFSNDEINYLKLKIGYLGNDEYFNWLKSIKLNPDNEIQIIPEFDINDNDKINLIIKASGNWEIITLYEIPILSLLSECYFKFVDTNWIINNNEVAILKDGEFDESILKPNFKIVHDQAYLKAKKLLNSGCIFSEFGTRRRRSYEIQKIVMQGIMDCVNDDNDNKERNLGSFLGTSNILFAKEFNVNPIGTIGHEWMMGVGAIQSIKTKNSNNNLPNYDAYLTANKLAMEQYVNLVGPNHAGLALTDTYGTDNFLNQFNEPYINYYIGVRQDSGDPKEYALKLSNWYKEKGYFNENKKMICFSDSLNVEKCIELKKLCDNYGIKSIFGIGTNFTNDFQSEPMNIVMKLTSCGGGHAIKISDNIAKNMGDPTTVQEVKIRLGYVEHKWAGGDEAHRWKK